MSYILGIDTGGTYTDGVLLDFEEYSEVANAVGAAVGKVSERVTALLNLVSKCMLRGDARDLWN